MGEFVLKEEILEYKEQKISMAFLIWDIYLPFRQIDDFSPIKNPVKVGQ